MTTTISISKELLADLRLLIAILGIGTYEEMIRSLMDSRNYNTVFFKRLREGVSE